MVLEKTLEADAVTDRINKLEEITEENYESMGSKVKSARRAYDKLDDATKALVPADAVNKLTTAEAKIEEYTAAANAPAVDPEPDPEPDTEPEEQPQEDPENTEDPADEPDTGDEPTADKGGSGTIVIIVIVAVVVVAGAAAAVIVIKKKKN